MRWARWLKGLIALGVLSAALWVLFGPIYQGYRAERDYHASRFVLGLVEEYVAAHRAWPNSWRDLEAVKRDERWDWPGNSRSIQKWVTVDFDANLDDLAAQSVVQFQAVRPIRPNALYDDEDLRIRSVGSLLKTVRRAASKREKPTAGERQRDLPSWNRGPGCGSHGAIFVSRSRRVSVSRLVSGVRIQMKAPGGHGVL